MKLFRPLIEVIREDRAIGWILLVFALTQLALIGWDLPSSYGWENDGVAPRDFFGGLAINLTPGEGHRYPLFHYLILAVGNLPVLLPTVLTLNEWSFAAAMERVLSVEVMTGCSIVAKLIAVSMGCIAVLFLARITRRIFTTRAGRWAALFAVTNLTLAYYGRTSNLDGPYMMWTVLAIDRLLTMAEVRRLRDYLLFGFFVGASVATKDQAYAAYVLVGPLYCLAVPFLPARPFGQLAAHFRRLALGAGVGVISLGLLGGGLLNPSGFLTRLRMLSGSNSGDWRGYEPGLEGLAANVWDILTMQSVFFWPWPMVAVGWLGVFFLFFGNQSHERGSNPVATLPFRLLPLLTALSAIVSFTLVVARCEHRFVLPFGLWLSAYGGVGCDALIRWFEGRSRNLSKQLGTAVTIALASLVLWGAVRNSQVHLTQWGDSRNRVEAYLAGLERGTVVETYGLLVYLPRFDTSSSSPYLVQRVSRRPLGRRNPLQGATEIDAPYGEVHERDPDVLVITEGFASRFLVQDSEGGRATSNITQRAQSDQDACDFFGAATSDTLTGYRLEFVAEPRLPSWAFALGARPVVVHGSTGRRLWVLVREAGSVGSD